MDDLGERTEEPTGKKLSESRQKGQVPKSQDLSGALSLFGGLIVFMVFGPTITNMFTRLMTNMLGGNISADVLSTESVYNSAKVAVYEGIMVVVPVLILAALISYLVNFMQVGWLLSAEPIMPKFNKLSPLGGIKRIFGTRGLVKTVVNLLKLVIMVSVSWLFIRSHMEDIAVLPLLGSMAALNAILGLIFKLAMILAILLVFLAIIDYIYQRYQHTKDLRMSKQEVKDERKSMEGDAALKGRRIQMAREVIMQQLGANVPQADVIVTNPTHFSVAIKYDPETMGAPKVIAKGADLLAFRIRQIARENEVPIVERPPLARALYWGVEVGQEVTLEHYEAVAELLAFVYRIDSKMERKMKQKMNTNSRADVPVGV
ncbi:MAG: flagellar biosynthesis protein FlhB [Phycisphaerales bacterium]